MLSGKPTPLLASAIQASDKSCTRAKFISSCDWPRIHPKDGPVTYTIGPMFRRTPIRGLTLVALAAFLSFTCVEAAELPRENIVLRSATSVDPARNTVVLPLHRGKANGKTVWYIVTDSSDRGDAVRRGVVYSPLLKQASVVQSVTQSDEILIFVGAPDFSRTRVFVPGPKGFPPTAAKPGSNVDTAYSPFIRINAGTTVLNAPILATGDGPFDVVRHTNTADRVLAIDVMERKVTLLLSHGFANGREVVYFSTEASDPVVATVERATYVPSLADAGGEISIIVFVNGQTGAGNPDGQGLEYAALSGKLDQEATLSNAPSLRSARNILVAFPTGATATTYSPLWAMNLAVWSSKAVKAKQNVLQTHQANVYKLLGDEMLAGANGKPFGPVGIVVNCPVVGYLDEAP